MVKWQMSRDNTAGGRTEVVNPLLPTKETKILRHLWVDRVSRPNPVWMWYHNCVWLTAGSFHSLLNSDFSETFGFLSILLIQRFSRQITRAMEQFSDAVLTSLIHNWYIWWHYNFCWNNVCFKDLGYHSNIEKQNMLKL